MDVSRADTEEECSFLKIENVISLAPRSNNTGNESPIVSENISRNIFFFFKSLKYQNIQFIISLSLLCFYFVITLFLGK